MIVSFIVRRLLRSSKRVEPVLPVRQCFCRSWRSDDSGRRWSLRGGYLAADVEAVVVDDVGDVGEGADGRYGREGSTCSSSRSGYRDGNLDGLPLEQTDVSGI